LKQSLAILLLSIHLFNICGYRVFYTLAETEADKQMTILLDADNYNDADLIQLKLPLHIPYTMNKMQYERCNGQIELNGTQYNYVKRMVQNDTLYLYCLPNLKKTEISNSKNQYSKQACSDVCGKHSERNASADIHFLKEYRSALPGFTFDAGNAICDQFFVLNNCTILEGFAGRHLQPPDMLS